MICWSQLEILISNFYRNSYSLLTSICKAKAQFNSHIIWITTWITFDKGCNDCLLYIISTSKFSSMYCFHLWKWSMGQTVRIFLTIFSTTHYHDFTDLIPLYSRHHPNNDHLTQYGCAFDWLRIKTRY